MGHGHYNTAGQHYSVFSATEVTLIQCTHTVHYTQTVHYTHTAHYKNTLLILHTLHTVHYTLNALMTLVYTENCAQLHTLYALHCSLKPVFQGMTVRTVLVLTDCSEPRSPWQETIRLKLDGEAPAVQCDGKRSSPLLYNIRDTMVNLINRPNVAGAVL